jgi:ribonucleoside-diphosphate reductase alpha chain
VETLHDVIEINAHGSGVGFNISSLRPRGSYIKKVNGTTSGAVSWAELYSVAAHDIIQHGGSRRGALMIMLWDWHPDIEEFITVKKEQGKLMGANLSVCVSDAFMNAVKKDKSWKLKFPDTAHEKYDAEWDGDISEWEKKGCPIKIYKTISARDLWDLICKSAWASAEPGIVFLDTYNKMNNSWYFEKIVSVNVCGEQGLPAWGMCNLSSLNLSAFVTNNKFDFDSYEEMIKIGVRFLDNATDTEKYEYSEIEEVQKRERRMGLGTMGLADALIKMKIRYGSEESLELIDKIYKTLRDV